MCELSNTVHVVKICVCRFAYAVSPHSHLYVLNEMFISINVKFKNNPVRKFPVLRDRLIRKLFND
jgi:hypothetical protein